MIKQDHILGTFQGTYVYVVPHHVPENQHKFRLESLISQAQAQLHKS